MRSSADYAKPQIEIAHGLATCISVSLKHCIESSGGGCPPSRWTGRVAYKKGKQGLTKEEKLSLLCRSLLTLAEFI